MARVITPKDCHALMNLLVKEATGEDSTINVVDTSTFVSAGETVMATGIDNVLNALSLVIGRTFMAVRPYEAKLNIINALSTDLFTSRMRKISFYSRKAQASGDFNTDLYTNLSEGYDNGTNGGKSTASMWVQNQPVALEMNFGGQSVWEDSTTIYEYQLKNIFRNEDEFASFVAGIMTEKGNDIESQKEAFNRMTLLNHIAGVYNLKDKMKGSVINLTEAYNKRFGTTYTSAELRTTYLQSFLEFFVSTFKITSDYMTNRTVNYHWSPEKKVGDTDYILLRHTDKSRQKAILYSPLFTEAKAQVFPEIFNEQYLNLENYEGVTYWQNINEPTKISVKPAIPDTVNNSGVQIEGAEVSIDYVVGMIYDSDAMMIDYQLETSATTPLEARKHYRNMWWSFSKNAINDFTENAVIFIMTD